MGSTQGVASSTHSRVSVLLLVCFLLAVTLACKKKHEASPAAKARAAELKPKASKVLAEVASLGSKAKAEPQTGSDVALGEKPWPKKVAVIGQAYLAEPNRTTTTDELDLGDPVLSVCKYIVNASQIKDDDIANLEACTGLEYAAVIRQQSYTPPDADEGATSYTPGSFSGDVLVFHLATGELRGRYSLLVSQSDQLELTSNSRQKPAAHEWRAQARAFLKNHVRAEALKKLQ